MRVAVVGPAHPYKGGGVHYTTMLAHRLGEDGHEVTLESWADQYPRFLYPGQLHVAEPELPLFHPTHRYLSWRRPLGWLRHGRRMAREADAVVFAYLSPMQALPYLVMMRAMRPSGVRRVVVAHNVVPHEPHKFDSALTGVLLRTCDAVLVHDRAQLAEAVRLTKRPVQWADMPPHFPGLDTQGPAEGGEPIAHDRLLFFGIVRPYKGLDVLLSAMASAEAKPTLVIAGEFWQSEQEVRALVSELGLSDRVEIRSGYVEAADIPGLFASADALVLPYKEATGSQNARLAFRYGVPVIATRTGALADAVRDGIDGLVCDPDNVDQLADAIDRFYAPGEPAHLRAGVVAQDDRASWRSYIETLLELIENQPNHSLNG